MAPESAILIPVQIGSQRLESNLFLSPLAGYTNLPFRLTVREVGGLGLATTDLVNARSLLEKNPKAFKLIETSPADRPLAVQLFGSIPEDVGVAAIFIHGRTREQGFSGTINLDGIRAVVSAVKNIPVVGNGDVTTPQAARKMLEETGCTGVSIGRGAFYNPWIFQHTLHYLRTQELLPEPRFEERVRVMCRHLDLMIEVFGEEPGCRMFRKVAPWYAKRFGPANEFNKRVVQICSKAEFHDVLEKYLRWRQQFLDEEGELKPKFRLAPLVASFMQEPAASLREH